ncbi:unnamed protein product [Dibothriocephalus latus]|uniref:Metal-dependent protein hydrolase n=1 Tax=Dibothriocephalus latus TaxID=60516 RepID=A0A3P7L551_DIBLA|nr:unnamed protein product [Dibothriocephalus latus]
MARAMIGTHNGNFHCDEVLAIAMLMQLLEYRNARIMRCRDMQQLATCNILVDVGGSFDLTIKDFYPNLEPAVKLSSAGLIYAHFGKRVITEIAGRLNSDEALEAVFKRQYFSKALALASTELVTNVRQLVEDWLPARIIVKNGLISRFSFHPSGMIAQLIRSGCPWMEHIFDLEKEERITTQARGPRPFSGRPVFVVTSGARMSSVIAVQINEDDEFSKRVYFPESWAGKRDRELDQAVGINGCVFVHTDRFLTAHKTLAGSLKMAVLALKAAGYL